MHLGALTALFKDEAFLDNLYLAANVAEFFLTAVLFYLAAKIKKLDRRADERAFRLNHFLLNNNLIEDLAASGESPLPSLLQAAYRSLEFLKGRRDEKHIGSYEEYRRNIASEVGEISDEAGMRKVLGKLDRRRAVLEYAEIAAFVLLITFQVFSTWFVFRPEA